MGSLRDPNAAQVAADELARARLSVAQETRQRAARRSREGALRGDAAARKALAADFAPVNPLESYRARAGGTP